MAVEIKELVIRAEIKYEPDGLQGPEGQQMQTREVIDESRIIQDCVKKVMKILRNEQKR